MYVTPARYATIVAFIQGYDYGSDEGMLEGFDDWVKSEITRRVSSLHWSGEIAEYVSPGLHDAGKGFLDLSADDDKRATSMLFAILENFFESKETD